MTKTIYKCDICGKEGEYKGFIKPIMLPCFACFENGEIYDTYGRYCHFMEYDLCPDCERRYAQVVMKQFAQIAYVPGGKTRIEKRYVE